MPRRSRNQTIENGGQTADEVKMERSSPYPSSVVRPLIVLTQRWPPSKTCATASPPPRRRRRSRSAMQMVAASKLRRAQAAAEAARPYATQMDKVLGNIAAAVGGLDTAPRLLRGSGSDNVHLLLVCTAERGLCGPFNSAIVRLARERANVADRRGQGGQVLLRRPQGLRSAAPALSASRSSRSSTCARSRTLSFEHAEVIARKGHRAASRNSNSTSARCSSPASAR